MKVELKLNGLVRSYEAANGEYLLETLRRNNVHSVRRGCDSTSCGVCTVLLDGKPVPSCSVLTLQAAGHAARLSVFFGKEGADQCGYCNPALALVVHALKQENPHPTPEEIDQYLVGNLCRCSGYKSQHKAIAAYLEDKS
jgi:carbon-monoxide dehydrogenase small subunit